jgi:hypothetical protein
MTVATDALGGGRFEMSRVIERTFGVLRRNITTFGLLALVLAALPSAVLQSGISLMARSMTGGGGAPAGVILMLVGVLVSLVTYYILQAAVVHGSVADLNGRPASFSACLQTGARSALPLFGLALLMGFAMMFGFMLLLVPGLIMMVVWIVAAPALVVERVGVFASFGRSARLTKGHRWAIFGLLFVFIVVYYLVSLLLGGAGMAAAGQDMLKTGLSPVQIAISSILSAVVSLVGSAGVSAIYYELRSAKEGVGPDTLAAVFD